MGVVASAPAKVILLGEHFVVYGDRSIALSNDEKLQQVSEAIMRARRGGQD